MSMMPEGSPNNDYKIENGKIYVWEDTSESYYDVDWGETHRGYTGWVYLCEDTQQNREKYRL